MSYSAGQELSSLAFDKIIGGALDAVVKAQSNSSITTVRFVKETGFLLNEKGEATEPIYVQFKYPKEVAPYQPPTPSRGVLRVKNGGSGYNPDNITGYKLNGQDVRVTLTVNDNGTILSATLESEDNIENGKLEITTDDAVTAAEIVCEKIEAKAATPAVYQDMSLKVPILTMLPIPFIRIASTDIEFNVKINSVENTTSSEESKKDIGGSASVGYSGFGVKAEVKFNASMSNQKKTSSTEEVKKEFSLNIKVHAVQDEMPAGISRILDILEESIVPTVAGARA